MNPVRVQRRRTKGWRMPENTVYVGRGSKWGNRWAIHQGDQKMDFRWVVGAGAEKFQKTLNFNDVQVMTFETRREAAAYAAQQYEKDVSGVLGGADGDSAERQIRDELNTLYTKNLACWCPLNQPCHADVLLEIANAEAQK